MAAYHQKVGDKEVEGQKGNLSIYKLFYVPTLTFSNKLQVVTDRIRSLWPETSVLLRMAGLGHYSLTVLHN